jgi:hypothetical protein
MEMCGVDVSYIYRPFDIAQDRQVQHRLLVVSLDHILISMLLLLLFLLFFNKWKPVQDRDNER